MVYPDLLGPVYHIILEILDIALGHDPSEYGYPGFDHGIRRAGHQGVPPVQVLPLGEPAVSAGFGKPRNLADILRGQAAAIGDKPLAVLVTGAAAGIEIQEPAGHVGVQNLAGVLVLKLVETALAAAVTERFPLRAGHFVERLALPERQLALLFRLFLLQSEHLHQMTKSTRRSFTVR